MPQIAQILETYASQIFWMLLTFGLIYFGIAKGMLPKIDANMQARDRKIADDLAAAQRAHAEAQSLEQGGDAGLATARAEAQGVTGAAKAKAAKDAEARVAKADAELAEKAATADAELAKARSSAMASIEAVAAEAAADVVAKVSGAKVTAAQAVAAVKGVLAHG